MSVVRELRLLTLSDDGSQLLMESADGGEHFALPVDAALRSAVAPRPAPASFDVPAPRHAALAPDAPDDAPPAIGPREIQIRVRAGESPSDLAAAFGMSLERVMRFAGPVLDERQGIAGEARRSRARRNAEDGETRNVLFGETVDARFRAHGVDADIVRWDARRRDDGEWLITASWYGGESTHTAEWLFSRASRSVTPLDEAAGDLLSDKPIRPMSPAPAPTPLTSAPALAPGVVAFPPMPDAHTAPVPALVEDVFDQEAGRPSGAKSAATPAADFDEPPLPLGLTDPAFDDVAQRPPAGARRNLGTGRRDESEEERAARARIPSWDDILLGIKRRD